MCTQTKLTFKLLSKLNVYLNVKNETKRFLLLYGLFLRNEYILYY